MLGSRNKVEFKHVSKIYSLPHNHVAFFNNWFWLGVYAIYTKQTTVQEGCSVLDFADSVSIAFFFFLTEIQ